jgi:cyclopropane fatty-acyl-phospholipid synthase-like methyltransferase
MEWLWPILDLQPGARVLDLGCGTAPTSIFLAKEYEAQVVAADLWVDPKDNWPRIQAADCAGNVIPLRAEAHDLPFAEGYFDAIVSVDAYHYFGTEQRYLAYLSRFLAPGGRIGIVVPGLVNELNDNEVPEHLRPYCQPDFWTFHSAQWWRQLWDRSGTMQVDHADLLDDGWREWALWCEVCAEASPSDFVLGIVPKEGEMVRQDAGRNLGFVRMAAHRL